jgi:hypothetical protein
MTVDLVTLLALMGLTILRLGVPILLIYLVGRALKYAAPPAP